MDPSASRHDRGTFTPIFIPRDDGVFAFKLDSRWRAWVTALAALCTPAWLGGCPQGGDGDSPSGTRRFLLFRDRRGRFDASLGLRDRATGGGRPEISIPPARPPVRFLRCGRLAPTRIPQERTALLQ